MICPHCQAELAATDCHGVRIEECPQCRGRWFDRDELRRAKDRTDEDLRWLDFDPFDHEVSAAADHAEARRCPRCSLPMSAVVYETSGVTIDVCPTCRGAWLEHGEFERIVAHLEEEVDTETAAQYRVELERKFKKIVGGPKNPVAELRDFFTILRLLEERLAVEHPQLAQAAEDATLYSPLR